MIALKNQGRFAICLIGLAVFCGASAHARVPGGRIERVLIELPKPYDRVVGTVVALGGRVTRQYRYVDAIAAEIPAEALEAVRAQIGPAAVYKMYKDVEVPLPSSPPTRIVHGAAAGKAVTSSADSGESISGAGISAYARNNPNAYSLNFAGNRIEVLHARGYTGAGTLVAVIDSGIRPGFKGLSNAVLGGEDFVGDGLGFSNKRNDPHGTFVAGLISNSAMFRATGPLKTAIESYAPEALDRGAIALLGAAPEAKIYALRIFGADASRGAHVSVILAAMQRVIDLRLAHDNGIPGGLKIDVCNMSFGATTLNAGRSLLDRSADALLAAGIVPVASAGDAGAATLTIASPASSRSSLAVGASSPAANERIGFEISFTRGSGIAYRPFPGTQTAWFSSRGPNADGRPSPDVVAAGVYAFSQGYCNSPTANACPNEVALNSGTSFSAPIAAGFAAVLRQAFPHASAVEIRNALAMTGRADRIQDGSQVLDRGTGLIDALGAFDLLASGNAPDRLPDFPTPSSDVRENVEANTNLVIYRGEVTRTISNLLPGERVDLLFDVSPDAAGVSVRVTNIQAELSPGSQNAFFGDGPFLGIHSGICDSHWGGANYPL
jgi:hypothetical protein